MKKRKVTSKLIEFTSDSGKSLKYGETYGKKLLVNVANESLVKEVEDSKVPPVVEPDENGYIQPSYDEEVNRLIRERYSVSQEFAIIRQRDTKPEEFKVYNDYCEECKAKVKMKMKMN